MARHAIVTGASRGIGRAIAIGLARRGYDLALTDIAAQEKVLLETVAEVRELGGRCIPVLGDVSDVGDCRRAVAEAIQGLGHIDVLVNNAGILRLATIDELTTEQKSQLAEMVEEWHIENNKAWFLPKNGTEWIPL